MVPDRRLLLLGHRFQPDGLVVHGGEGNGPAGEPLDDAGLVKGISQNYFSGEPVSRSDMREVAEAWKPWCTVATWFIWRSLEPVPVAY